MRAAQSGVNPVEARRTKAADVAKEAQTKEAETFGAVAARYLKEYVEKNTRPATIKETRRIIERDVKPRWGTTPIREISRREVNALLDEIADRGALVQANRTLARFKTLFSWAVDEDLIDGDPTARVRKRIKETARDRALSDDEIRLFWAGCDKLGWPFGPMFKLLLLTAQRRDELGRWSGESSIWPPGGGPSRARRRRMTERMRFTYRSWRSRSSTTCPNSRDRSPTAWVRNQAPTSSPQTASDPSPDSARPKRGSTNTWCNRSAATSRKPARIRKRSRSKVGSFTTSGGPRRPVWLGSTSHRMWSTNPQPRLRHDQGCGCRLQSTRVSRGAQGGTRDVGALC